MAVAHLALDLRLSGVSAATESTATTSSAPAADEQLGDLERLLAVVGLRDEEVVDLDADPARVAADPSHARRR